MLRWANKGGPTVRGNERSVLRYRYSEAQIAPKNMTSTNTLISRCFQNHMCYIQTGTLMMNISGSCDLEPLIVCDRYYFPCEEFRYTRSRLCSQWAEFTQKYCQSGVFEPKTEDCSLTVAVTGINGTPISFQVFEQKPMSGKSCNAKCNLIEPDSLFGELPDGSSGVWMAWSPSAQ